VSVDAGGAHVSWLNGSVIGHRSITPRIKLWLDHVGRMFHLSFCLTTYTCCSTPLAYYHVHTSGHETTFNASVDAGNSLIISFIVQIKVSISHGLPYPKACLTCLFNSSPRVKRDELVVNWNPQTGFIQLYLTNGSSQLSYPKYQCSESWFCMTTDHQWSV